MARKLTVFKGLCYNSPRQTGCGNSSVVEHNLAKVGVAGSNPVSRSTFECGMWRRSQVAKAEVCKTSIQRFESARRLHMPRTAVIGPGWRNWETQRT